MTATFGGPLINAKAEIQNLDGESIPGLYAAGNSAGGIFFHNYAGGAQLGAALVYGRIAGAELRSLSALPSRPRLTPPPARPSPKFTAPPSPKLRAG